MGLFPRGSRRAMRAHRQEDQQMASIPVLTAKDPQKAVISALERDGCVVVTGVIGEQIRRAVAEEIAPHLERADENAATDRKSKYYVDTAGFYPGHTKRITALLAKSKTVGKLALDPVVLGACDAVLKPNCRQYHLHAGAALVVGPGATTQVLHREDDLFPFFKLPRPNLVLASMWAITDFTAANGATNLVPGSHLWPEGRTAEPGQIAAGEMPAGSVLIWMGGTLHGAGANTSDGWRFGVFLSYSLGWLRQEENQFLDVPPSLARTLPKGLRDLVGYKMHGGLGFAEIPEDSIG
jgi:ectoine hydroxylase-related dioxygenase (phytanoyl-CoA dioxygenase family)